MVIAQPSADTANIRHERTGDAVEDTVHAPQTPCSQPRWVPVRPQVVPQAVRQQPASGNLYVARAAVDDQAAPGILLLRSSALSPSGRGPAGRRREPRTRRDSEHPDQVPPVVGAGMDIAIRLDLRGCRLGGRSDITL